MILIVQHFTVEGPGTFGAFFKNSKWDLQTIDLSKPSCLFKQEGFSPKDFSELKGVLVLGGPMNAYEEDKFPFLKAENYFLQQLIEKDIPTLGICLGAQLLAKAQGAKVKKANSKEIGWYKVSLTKDAQEDQLFKGLDNKSFVFQWHEDTFELPQKAVLLAEGSGCKNQAVRFSKYSWGIQFHPEMNLKMLKSWLNYYSPDLGREKVLTKYFCQQENYLYQARTICENFIKVIIERQESSQKKLANYA